MKNLKQNINDEDITDILSNLENETNNLKNNFSFNEICLDNYRFELYKSLNNLFDNSIINKKELSYLSFLNISSKLQMKLLIKILEKKEIEYLYIDYDKYLIISEQINIIKEIIEKYKTQLNKTEESYLDVLNKIKELDNTNKLIKRRDKHEK